MTTEKSSASAKQTPKKATSDKTKTTSGTGAKAARDKTAHRSDKPMPEGAKETIGLKLNWNRAIHIDTRIDDTMLRALTPTILKLKQESTDPITVGIDSPGGSISVMQSLINLLKAPDQDGNRTDIYTVSTNRAYSAAASLLAHGDYSVAFPHSEILYHDVRYAGIEDVSPSKALRTARELERGNAASSLTLAHQVCPRLVWVYLDLKPEFAKARRSHERLAAKHDEAFADILPSDGSRAVDIVGFALALFNKLSFPTGRATAIEALHLVNSWMQIEKIERRLCADRKGKREAIDVTKGIDDLVTEIREMNSGDEDSAKSPEHTDLSGSDGRDLVLLLEVIARRVALDKNLDLSEDGFDRILDDFAFIKDINSPKHVRAITRLMIDHDVMFFGRGISTELSEAKDETELAKIIDPVFPQVRMLWFYIVSLCRCLSRGEHFLTPYDAQLLGLVDEVLSGGLVVSKREWRKSNPDHAENNIGD